MALGAAAASAGLTADPLMLAAYMGAVFGLAASVSVTLWCTIGSLLTRSLRSPHH
jgi:hypothetical protein